MLQKTQFRPSNSCSFYTVAESAKILITWENKWVSKWVTTMWDLYEASTWMNRNRIAGIVINAEDIYLTLFMSTPFLLRCIKRMRERLLEYYIHTHKKKGKECSEKQIRRAIIPKGYWNVCTLAEKVTHIVTSWSRFYQNDYQDHTNEEVSIGVWLIYCHVYFYG